MELTVVYALAAFLILIAISAYLHIKYKIDWKYACVLPVLTIGGVLLIINNDQSSYIRKFKIWELEIETAKQEFDEKVKDSLGKIRDEAAEQRKSFELLIGKANEIALQRMKSLMKLTRKRRMQHI
jgi:hypothetical protein